VGALEEACQYNHDAQKFAHCLRHLARNLGTHLGNGVCGTTILELVLVRGNSRNTRMANSDYCHCIDSMANCVRDSLDHLTKSGQLILRADAPTHKKGTNLITLFRDQTTPSAVTRTSPKRDIVLDTRSPQFARSDHATPAGQGHVDMGHNWQENVEAMTFRLMLEDELSRLDALDSPWQQDRAPVTLEGNVRPVSSTAVGSPENALEGRIAPICVFLSHFLRIYL